MRGYANVPIEECIHKTGEHAIGLRWVDVSKQDETQQCRLRFMVKGTTGSPMQALYAATPPLGRLRVIISDVVTFGSGSWPPRKIMVCDVCIAYFYVPPIRPVYFKIIDDDSEEGVRQDVGASASLYV